MWTKNDVLFSVPWQFIYFYFFNDRCDKHVKLSNILHSVQGYVSWYESCFCLAHDFTHSHPIKRIKIYLDLTYIYMYIIFHLMLRIVAISQKVMLLLLCLIGRTKLFIITRSVARDSFQLYVKVHYKLMTRSQERKKKKDKTAAHGVKCEDSSFLMRKLTPGNPKQAPHRTTTGTTHHINQNRRVTQFVLVSDVYGALYLVLWLGMRLKLHPYFPRKKKNSTLIEGPELDIFLHR